MNTKEIPSDWLDTVIEEASESPNAQARANAVVALSTLGGQHRIALLVKLVGNEGLKARAGDGGASDVINVALSETAPGVMRAEDRAFLDVELLRRVRGRDATWHRAARTLLGKMNAFRRWRGLRALTLRKNALLGIWPALQGAVMGSLAVYSLAMGLGSLYFDMQPSASSDLLFLALIVLDAVVGAFVGALWATPRARHWGELAIDAVVSGSAAALGFLFLAFLFAVIWARSGDWSRIILYGTVFLVLAMPGLVAIRLLVGAGSRDVESWKAILAGVGWPVLGVTAAALAGEIWLPVDFGSAISLAWVAFITLAAGFAPAIRKVDEAAGAIPAISSSSPGIGLMTLPLSALIVILTSTVCRFAGEYEQDKILDSPAETKIIGLDRWFTIRAPADSGVALEWQRNEFFAYAYVDQPSVGSAFDDSPVYDRGRATHDSLRLESAEHGARICFVKYPFRQLCDQPAAGPFDWLVVLTGHHRSSLGEDSEPVSVQFTTYKRVVLNQQEVSIPGKFAGNAPVEIKFVNSGRVTVASDSPGTTIEIENIRGNGPRVLRSDNTEKITVEGTTTAIISDGDVERICVRPSNSRFRDCERGAIPGAYKITLFAEAATEHP